MYLKATAIIKLHEWLVKSAGGDAVILHRDLVDSIADRPLTTIASFGDNNAQNLQEMYPDLFSKAVSLAYALITWHAFFDGNKRTGLFSMALTFELNGIHFHWAPYLTKYSVQAATEEINEEQFGELVRPLISNNFLSHIWKTLKYETLPSLLMSLLRFTKIAERYRHHLLVDWYAAGHEEIFEKLIEERVQFNPNIPLEMEDDDFLVQN